MVSYRGQQGIPDAFDSGRKPVRYGGISRPSTVLVILAVGTNCGMAAPANPARGPGLPDSMRGSITFAVNSDHELLGGRVERGEIPSIALKRDAADPRRYTGVAQAKVNVDYRFKGMACDPVVVLVKFKVDLRFDRHSVAAMHLLGATGTYTAQSRCCAGDICQPQDVSNAITLAPGCNGGQFLRGEATWAASGNANYKCEDADSLVQQKLIWGFQ